MKHFVLVTVIGALFSGVYGCSAQSTLAKPDSAKLVIPSGTVLKVALIDAISTERSTPGDYFSASLAEGVVIDGRTLLEEGTPIRGRVFDLRQPRRSNGGGALHLILIEIMYQGKTIGITTQQFASADDVNIAARGGEVHYVPKTRLDFILAAEVEM